MSLNTNNSSMSTEDFFNLVHNETEKAKNRKKKNREIENDIDDRLSKEKDELQIASNELAKKILKNWKNKAKKSAQKGRIYVDLYTLKDNEEKRHIFLICAPIGEGLQWFRKKGITPVLDIIKNEVKPFKIQYLRLQNYNNYKNVIRLNWAPSN